MSSSSKPSLLRFLPAVGRWLLGLPLILSGFMILFHPMQAPPDMAVGAKAFSDALQHSGYMMPMIAIVLSLSGLLLVINRFVPLALLLLAPFFVNSVLFHSFLEPTGLPMAGVFALLVVALAWAYRGVFAAVLKAKNSTGP